MNIRNKLRAAIALAVLLPAIVVLLPARVLAAAGGSLDPTFDGDGKAAIAFPVEGQGRAYDMAIQSDGKIVTIGVAGPSQPPPATPNSAPSPQVPDPSDKFLLTRQNPDGSLDTSFDGDGRAVTAFGNNYAIGHAVAIQSDGKIVVAGESYAASFTFARYNTDGSLDTTFDGDGRALIDFPAEGASAALGVALQSNGKIVAAGYAGSNFAVVRLNADGTADSSFDGDGRVVTPFPVEGYPQANDVVVQSDGKIVAGGRVGSPSVFALARYNSDGSLDASFDGDGRAVASSVGGYGKRLALQSDGKILLCGSSGNSSVAVLRFNTDGGLDSTFDGDGVAVTPYPAEGYAYGEDLSIASGGRIVVAGQAITTTSVTNMIVTRYNSDGSLDSTFDGDGRVVTTFDEGASYADGIGIQSDGKIVTAGAAGLDVAVARYLSGAPDAPANLTATPGDGSVTLNWTAPNDNGSPTTGYRVYRSTSSGSETLYAAIGNTTTYTDTGVTNGTRYYYKVAAVNAQGTGPQSNEASAVPSGTPSAPLNLTATGGQNKITLNWQPPSSNGGSAITGYQIYRGTASGNETALTSVGNQTSYIDSGLGNGATFFYKVRAVNSTGAGAYSNEASATTWSVASAPLNLTASAGNAQVTLNWSAPSSNGGTAITGYSVYRSTSSGTETLLTTIGNVLTYTDTAVTNGTTYFYKVAAVNAAGTGPKSNEASATPHASVPTAPQNLTATAGNAQIVLNWTAPSSNGGSPITGYKIFRSTSSGTETLYATVGNVLTYTDTAVTNGTTYFYKVAAVNAAGTGPQSNEASATPKAPPSAPLNLTAAGGNAKITLNWSAPSSNGGSAITGYKIYRSTSSGTETLYVSIGNALTYSDTAVTVGTRYFYKVAAVNAIGIGPKSNEASAVPATPPTAPVNFAIGAGPGRGEMSLSWQPPASNGYAAITAYKIYRGTTPGGEVLVKTVGNVLGATDAGLADGTYYYYRVSAVNAAGEGTQSSEELERTFKKPSAPQALAATAASGSVTLTWQAPVNDGGTSITGYKVYRSTSAGTEALYKSLGNVLTFTDTAVTNGTTYYYKVAAQNVVGVGPQSIETSAKPGAAAAWSQRSAPSPSDGGLEPAWLRRLE